MINFVGDGFFFNPVDNLLYFKIMLVPGMVAG